MSRSNDHLIFKSYHQAVKIIMSVSSKFSFSSLKFSISAIAFLIKFRLLHCGIQRYLWSIAWLYPTSFPSHSLFTCYILITLFSNYWTLSAHFPLRSFIVAVPFAWRTSFSWVFKWLDHSRYLGFRHIFPGQLSSWFMYFLSL